MRIALPSSRTYQTAGLLAVAVLALVGCSSGGSDEVARTDDGSAPDVTSTDVPPECKAAFPTAFGTPDIADVRLLPADWPGPPPGSTLCQTSETVGGSREEVDYATELAPDEIFAAYESTLAPSYKPVRDKSGLGEDVLVGVADGVDFQISADEGKFSIALAK